MKNKLCLIAILAIIGFLAACGDGGGGTTTVPVTGVTLNKSNLSLNMGSSETLTATVAPENATNKAVTWSSSNEAIATVTTNGVVTAVAAGSTTITVTTADGGKETKCSVDVNDPSLSTLSGTVTISPSGTVAVNTELTATYSGTEAVSFQWKKDGNSIGTATTANPNKYTPTQADSYSVTVSLAGYNSKTSAPVTVTNGSTGGGNGNSIWTVVDCPITPYAFAYGGGTYVVGGDGGKIAYSSDGNIWTEVTDSPFETDRIIGNGIIVTVRIMGIAYGSGKFVAIAMDSFWGYGSAAYSEDGINWTAIPPENGPSWSIYYNSNRHAEAIAYGNDRFMTVGSKTVQRESFDGVTWRLGGNPGFQNDLYYNAIAWGNGKFVAGGQLAQIVADGERIMDPLFASEINHITFGNGKFVAQGGWTLAYSTDGIVWTEINKKISSGYGPRKFVYGNDGLILPVRGEVGLLTVSTDWINWYDIDISRVFSNGFSAIEYCNDKLFLGGENKIAYSSGLNYSQLSGTVTISQTSSSNAAELTATYSGSETVFFQWKKDGSIIGTPSTANPNKFRPTMDGNYTVTVSGDRYYAKTSNQIPFSRSYGNINAEIGTYLDFYYLELGEQAVFIYDYKGSGGSVTIPSQINGKSVLGIWISAFKDCDNITSVTIPNSVRAVMKYSFSGCTSLTSVTIPNGVGVIDVGAFEYCSSLTSVTIPNSIMFIGDGAFQGCTRLTSVTFASGSNITGTHIDNGETYDNFGDSVFPEGNNGTGGNTLKTAYNTGKAGTYTRADYGDTWSK